MNVHFECTQCGRCCHNLKLPLSVAEAIAWLEDGHAVEVLCEAAPQDREPDATDALGWHRRSRSFAACSGVLPVRISVVLAATFDGACPHLQADQRCGNYERRPLVCRIYPAEVRPGMVLQPTHKACPPEAWTAERPILLHQGHVADADLRTMIQRSRDDSVQDVATKARACAALGLSCAGLADEGWAIHAPAAATLLRELRLASQAGAPIAPAGSWQVWSNRRSTVAELVRAGAASEFADPAIHRSWAYRGLHPASG